MTAIGKAYLKGLSHQLITTEEFRLFRQSNMIRDLKLRDKDDKVKEYSVSTICGKHFTLFVQYN